MDKGFALDIEMWLAPVGSVAHWVSDDDGASLNGATPQIQAYEISDVKFNLCLVKIDQALCKRYDEIACDESEKFVVPFRTFHTHTSSVSSQNQTVFISDNCTDLRKIYTVFTPNLNPGLVNTGEPFPFKGSCSEDDAERIVGYNYKLGNEHVYNQEIVETDSNHISMNHFINAHHRGAKNQPAMMLTRLDMADPTYQFKPIYQSANAFVICPDFTYSEESTKGVVQGVSPGALPITANFKFAAQPNMMCHNFVECGYSLIVKGGALTFIENKLTDEYNY